MACNTYDNFTPDEFEIRKSESAKTLTIPEDIVELAAGAFDIYNGGNLVEKLFPMLIEKEHHIQQWKKKLSRTQIVKKKFPKGIKTLNEKATYMYQKDTDERLQNLVLPKSLKVIWPTSFPILLKSIQIDESNPYFKTKDGGKW